MGCLRWPVLRKQRLPRIRFQRVRQKTGHDGWISRIGALTGDEEPGEVLGPQFGAPCNDGMMVDGWGPEVESEGPVREASWVPGSLLRNALRTLFNSPKI
jgi:hypothetical protein